MSMNKQFIGSAVLSFSAVALGHAQEVKHPNVVLVMTDQQRADLCKREGFPLDVMPFMDQLAQENIWFDKAYTTAPASSPARVSMLTGRFPKATHVRTNHNVNDAFYEKDMPAVFREQGYKTALIGKNHSHTKPACFDYWSGYGHWGKDKKDTHNSKEFASFLNNKARGHYLAPTPFDVETQLPCQIVSQTLDWIEDNKAAPFFAWVSIPEPHNPYQVSEPYYSMFPPESIPQNKGTKKDLKRKGEKYETLNELETLSHANDETEIRRLQGNYLGMLRLIDDQMKRLIEGLKEKGLYENTIFIYLSDHGDYFGEYGLVRKGAGVPDALTRIPMVWAGYGIKQQAKPMEAHVSIADVFPTLCTAIGAEIPVGVQGRSLWPMLEGEKYPRKEFESILVEQGFGGADFTRKEALTFEEEGALTPGKTAHMDELNTWTQSGARRMLRKGDWKIIVDNYSRGELYHLEKDPSELNNLFDNKKYDSKRAELLLDLAGWEIRTQDPLPIPQRRYQFKRNRNNYLFTE